LVVKTEERLGAGRADGVRRRWRSPIRGPWLTSVFGLVLLIGIPVEFVTGLLSYAAYNPKLGNDPNPAHGIFGFYLFDWFTEPVWAYRLIQGVHVILGLALVPVVLAKLWSVMPRLFEWPPFTTLARLLERITLVMLVGGVAFEMLTGILNIGYLDHFGAFYTGHFYGAWIFGTAFVVHVALKLPKMIRALRSRRMRTELRTGLAGTRPEPYRDEPLVAIQPAEPTISRRGALALVGGASLAVLVFTAGETVGGPLRRIAWFGNRYASPGTGANHFPVNHTAEAAGIDLAETGPGWRLELVGARTVTLSRNQLLAMPQITETLPIACTEGWSTVQRWTGVRLSDLATLAGIEHPVTATVDALDNASVVLAGSQVGARQSMLALKVNGADLSLDHGYPARIMIPSTPGSTNRKWMRRITFEPGDVATGTPREQTA
jgi:DMSO/TMAO reductase YedYZ molybdopterin-dependent catalytic subunit